MATTILRVKRRLDESPAEALVLHCKRAKLDEKLEPSVFIFSGTVNEKESSETYLRKVWSNNRENLLNKTKTIDEIKSKLAKEKKSNDRRIEVIDYSRGLIDSNPDDDYALLDLCGSHKTEENNEFAYDFYFSHENNIVIDDIDDIDMVHPLNYEFFNDRYRNGGNLYMSDDSDDGEDSNDENYYKNEYPDTDDSIDEDDMIRAAQNIAIGEDLSSDEGDELVYQDSMDTKIKLNRDDVDRYGLAYATYKSKILLGEDQNEKLPELIHYDDSQIRKSPSNSDDDDNEFYYPKNDDMDDGDYDSCSEKIDYEGDSDVD